MSQSLNDFERAVLARLLSGESATLTALQRQFEHCRVKSRECTGVGFFTYLEVDRSAVSPVEPAAFVLDDAIGAHPDLKHGADFILFVRGGYVDLLEGVSIAGEPWPTTSAGFKIQPYAARLEG
jgi:hypothetical protein